MSLCLNEEISLSEKTEVFDPAMRCSTGVCVEVDPVLAQFSADLKWVAEQGIHVERYNLARNHRLLQPTRRCSKR